MKDKKVKQVDKAQGIIFNILKSMPDSSGSIAAISLEAKRHQSPELPYQEKKIRKILQKLKAHGFVMYEPSSAKWVIIRDTSEIGNI